MGGVKLMTNINIVFDDVYDDVDIIAVPDEIVPKIEELGQEFLFWIPTAEDSDYCTIIDEKKCSVAETDGFIKWLNSFYCKNRENAYVVARNTNYCPKYKIVEF